LFCNDDDDIIIIIIIMVKLATHHVWNKEQATQASTTKRMNARRSVCMRAAREFRGLLVIHLHIFQI
jgi:hypothetical protein